MGLCLFLLDSEYEPWGNSGILVRTTRGSQLASRPNDSNLIDDIRYRRKHSLKTRSYAILAAHEGDGHDDAASMKHRFVTQTIRDDMIGYGSISTMLYNTLLPFQLT